MAPLSPVKIVERPIGPEKCPTSPAFLRARGWFCILGWLLVALMIPRHGDGAQHSTVAKIGLALSGGGARGAAHVGVLKILEREGIQVDCIAGTSFGALVGGLFALGYSAVEIEKILADQDWSAVFSNDPDFTLAPLPARAKARYQGEINFKGFLPELPSGLLAGQRLTEILNQLTTERMAAAGFDFDRLSVPFRAVSTNLADGNPYVFRNGSMAEAIRASIAVPFLFTPVEKDGLLLIDGGLSDNLPTDVVREMGATIVIAVDVSSPLLEKQQIKSFLEVVDQSISFQVRRDVQSNLKLADLVLRPDLQKYYATDYSRMIEIVSAGAQAAEEKLAELKALLAPVPRRPPRPAPVLQTVPEIVSVSFDGLKEIPASQLRNEIKARPGQLLNIRELQQDLRRLYARGEFEHVDFRLLSAGDSGYHLVYLLRESPARSLGASIRYDLDFNFVALAEFRMRQLFRTPSVLTITAQFGGLDCDSANLRYVPLSRLPFFFVAPEVHLSRREYQDYRGGQWVDRFTKRQVGGQLMFGAVFRKSEIEFGYRTDRVSIAEGTLPNRLENAVHLRGMRVRLTRNTLDAQRFPSRGTSLFAQVDRRAESLGSDVGFTKWEADFRRYLPISGATTLHLSGTGGRTQGSIPFYERFFIGGLNYSDVASHKLVGFGLDELAASQMGILAAEFRQRWFHRPLGFAKSGFVSAYYNAAWISTRARSPYDFNLFQGVGAGLAFETVIGPVRLAGGWGQRGRYNVYFTFGPAF